jgi:hypothetical protein
MTGLLGFRGAAGCGLDVRTLEDAGARSVHLRCIETPGSF